MQDFIKQFTKLEGRKGKVILLHQLFDMQTHVCDKIHIINDDTRIGVRINGQDLFVYKQFVRLTDISSDGCDYRVGDGMLSIFIFVENL